MPVCTMAGVIERRIRQQAGGTAVVPPGRGGISVRLRAEDAQTVAKECGTSLQMLDRHYAFAIDDLRRFGPRPFNELWMAARGEDNGPPTHRLVA